MRITRWMVVLLVLTVSAVSAFADSVNIGYVQGCFNGPNGTCSNNSTTPETLGQYDSTNPNLLKFNGGNPGGNNIDVTPYSYQVTLGTFSSKDVANATLGDTFTGQLTFTAPPGTLPPDWDVTADISGTVSFKNSTTVLIDFSNASQAFTYSYTAGGNLHQGTFYVNVDDVTLDATGLGGGYDTASAAWYGHITSSPVSDQDSLTPVPEPGSMMLLGTGLVGLAGTIRRKLKR